MFILGAGVASRQGAFAAVEQQHSALSSTNIGDVGQEGYVGTTASAVLPSAARRGITTAPSFCTAHERGTRRFSPLDGRGGRPTWAVLIRRSRLPGYGLIFTRTEDVSHDVKGLVELDTGSENAAPAIPPPNEVGHLHEA